MERLLRSGGGAGGISKTYTCQLSNPRFEGEVREGITHLVLFITFAIDSFDSPWTVGHVFFILSLGWDLDLVVFFFLWEFVYLRV